MKSVHSARQQDAQQNSNMQPCFAEESFAIVALCSFCVSYRALVNASSRSQIIAWSMLLCVGLLGSDRNVKHTIPRKGNHRRVLILVRSHIEECILENRTFLFSDTGA